MSASQTTEGILEEDSYSFEVELPGVTFMGVQIGDEMNISAHGGSYDGARASFTTEDLDSGLPLQIAVPTRLPDEGRTRHVRSGLYISTADIEALTRWYRNGEEIIGENGYSYTLTAADEGRTIEYRETPSTIFGATGPYILVVQAGYPEVGLIFDDATKFTTPPFTVRSSRALMFLSFAARNTMNHWALRGSGFGLYISASQLPTLGNKYTIFPKVTGRVHILMSLDSGAISAVRWYDGTIAVSAPVTGAGIFQADSQRIYVNEIKPAGTPTKEFFTLYRAAVWDLTSYGSVPDVTTTAVQEKFFAGGILKDPEMPGGSRDTYGDALVDVYGTADFLNAGTGQHHGTLGGGTFASYTGAALEA